MEIKKFSEEFELDYKDLAELSYETISTAWTHESWVRLYKDSLPVAYLEIWVDVENGEREYVCINYEIIYLDTLKKK